MIKANINKIIDSSVVDGPGNRTVIFFQVCNFNCKYCHNPETINHCMNCQECVISCSNQALTVVNEKVVWNKAKCIDCDTCIKTCKHDASPKILNLTVGEVVLRIKMNLPFITGITVSGGECTLQKDFLIELFKETKKLGLTNFIDSNGSIKFSEYPDLLENTDAIMLDIKTTDYDEHVKLTSKNNVNVLDNALFLASIGKLYEIRTVIIKNYLNNQKTVYEITNMLKEYQKIKEIRYKLICFRPFGVREKYRHLETPTENEMNYLKNIATENGFKNILILS